VPSVLFIEFQNAEFADSGNHKKTVAPDLRKIFFSKKTGKLGGISANSSTSTVCVLPEIRQSARLAIFPAQTASPDLRPQFRTPKKQTMNILSLFPSPEMLAVASVDSSFWIVPIASVIALAFAWHFYSGMKKEEEGTDVMRKIAGHVRSGALAYLRQQYKVVGAVFVIITIFFAFLAYGLKVQNDWVPFAFITGGFFSGLAGFFGMKTATYASNRSAWAANHSLDKGLRVAFRSGAVMGLVVVGLALLDISVWFVVLNYFIEDASQAHKMVVITTTMLTFGMGASLQALFARVGGGIFTKSARTWSARSRLAFPRTTPATPRQSRTT